MPILLIPALGFAAGLHAASYGAYKDSPHESFLLRRFLRELVFASVLALGLAASGLARGVEWLERRHLFLWPYVLSWALYAVLCASTGWF